MQMSRSDSLSFLIQEFDGEHLLGIDPVFVRFMELRSFNAGIFDARVLE